MRQRTHVRWIHVLRLCDGSTCCVFCDAGATRSLMNGEHVLRHFFAAMTGTVAVSERCKILLVSVWCLVTVRQPKPVGTADRAPQRFSLSCLVMCRAIARPARQRSSPEWKKIEVNVALCPLYHFSCAYDMDVHKHACHTHASSRKPAIRRSLCAYSPLVMAPARRHPAPLEPWARCQRPASRKRAC